MIINVCGFGWSGSGAYLDLLREYDETTFPNKRDWEFNLLWVPDGLYDLEYKLCHKHCRIFDSALAIERFLTIAKEYGSYLNYDDVLKTSFYSLCENYINELVQFRLEGNTIIHKLHPSVKDRLVRKFDWFLVHLFMNRISRKLKCQRYYATFHITNYKKMMVSYNPDNFEEVTQRFVSSILDCVRDDNTKALVLDQSFPPDMPYLFDHFFSEEHKTIVVRRDPRDNYILMNKLKGTSRPVPTDIDDYIMFYKKSIAETIQKDSDILLSVHYEDLIYNYESTIEKLEKFLGFNKQDRKGEFFDPTVSINNTQLIRLYPEFKDDIQKIEYELSDYLYPFENYTYKRSSNNIF